MYKFLPSVYVYMYKYNCDIADLWSTCGSTIDQAGGHSQTIRTL